MAEKYEVSLWKNYTKSIEAEIPLYEGSSLSTSITPNETESSLYFYFQYPKVLTDTFQWQYYRPRYKLFDNSSAEDPEITLICTNLENLSNKNNIKFLISKSVLSSDSNDMYETLTSASEGIKSGDKLVQQDIPYVFQNLEIGVYWAKGTYYEIHGYAASSNTPFTVNLKRGHSGMIWYAVAHLKDEEENDKYELLMTYSLSDYQEALKDLLSGNYFENPKYWERIGDGSGGYYYYAESGLSFLDKPSDINDYFRGNNRLMFSVKNYKIKYKGIELKTGSRVKIDNVSYSFIYADVNGICCYDSANNKIFFRYADITSLYGIFDYTDERQIFTITDSEMRALCRGREPRLKVNINGTKEFYFNLYYNYIDNETGEEVNNPFVPLIFNESKIKVQWDGEWYDFVVKDIKEDTSQRYISYTCKDLFIHELSKNGYSIELDDELMNNQGSIQELGEIILEGSDWKVAEDSDLIYQYVDEPLYILEDTELELKLEDILSSNEIEVKEEEILKIGIFYSSRSNIIPEIECLYPIDETTIKDRDGLVLMSPKIRQYKIIEGTISLEHFSINTNYRGRRVVESQKTQYDSLVEKNVLLYNEGDVHGWFQTRFRTPNTVANLFINYEKFINTKGWTTNLPGTEVHLITDPVFPPTGAALKNILSYGLLEQLTSTGVDLVSNGYTLSEGDYIFTVKNKNSTPEIVHIYLVSGVSSALNTSIQSSSPNGSGTVTLVDLESGEGVTRTINEINTGTTIDGVTEYYYTLNRAIKSYIDIKYEDANENRIYYYNEGLYKNARYLENGLQSGQLYCLRYKKPGTQAKHRLSLSIKSDYAPEYPSQDDYLVYQSGMSYLEDGYIYDFYKVGQGLSLTKDELVSGKWVFQIAHNVESYKQYNIRLEEIQFFEVCLCQKDGEKYLLLPGEIEKEPLYQTYLYLYSKSANNFINNKDDISYLYAAPFGSYDLVSGKTITYSEDLSQLLGELDLTEDLTYEKITSISQKESNRYNLIQKGCEKFQCWAQFLIRHDEQTGKILTLADLEEDDSVPIKQIRFKKDLTVPKGISFTDGLDLNSINKTLTSQDIVTKMYVKPNTTEAADGGVVTIAKSELNPSLDTYILNFDYYVSAGFINADSLQKDLWGTDPSESLTYYKILKELNAEYDKLISNRTRIKGDLDEDYAYQDTYQNYVLEGRNELQTQANNLTIFVNGLKNSQNNTIVCDNFATAVQHILSKNFLNYTVPDRAIIRFLTFLFVNSSIYDYSKKLDELNRIIPMLENQIKEIDIQIEEILAKKKALEEIFSYKYGNYIFEGVWNSSDYIDNNKYFYDAVNVAYTSSRPTIKYTFNVIRLAALEEYKDRRIQVGDIDYVQDSKLFGYKEDGITPNKEKVVVSEIMYYFDSPEKDVVTIQNYRTQFEDLMSRIVATVQTPQYAPVQYTTEIKATVTSPSLPTYKV